MNLCNNNFMNRCTGIVVMMVMLMCVSPTWSRSAHPSKKSFNCKEFCDNTGYQGTLGPCNCGFILFKRSGKPVNAFQGQRRGQHVTDALEALSDQELHNSLATLSELSMLSREADPVSHQQSDLDDISKNELDLLLWLLSAEFAEQAKKQQQSLMN